MSNVYIQRLRRIQAEFHAAQDALIYVSKNWQRQNIFLVIERVAPRAIVEAERNVEATYLIRLYAEFEGILKDHLATNHPRIRLLRNPKVDWLISRVVQAEAVTIEQALRGRLDDFTRLSQLYCPP